MFNKKIGSHIFSFSSTISPFGVLCSGNYLDEEEEDENQEPMYASTGSKSVAKPKKAAPTGATPSAKAVSIRNCFLARKKK